MNPPRIAIDSHKHIGHTDYAIWPNSMSPQRMTAGSCGHALLLGIIGALSLVRINRCGQHSTRLHRRGRSGGEHTRRTASEGAMQLRANHQTKDESYHDQRQRPYTTHTFPLLYLLAPDASRPHGSAGCREREVAA